MSLRERIERARRRRQLRRGIRQAAEEKLASGDCSQEERDACYELAHNRQHTNELLHQLETEEGALGGIDWSRIKEWFIENWPKILKLVFSILLIII